MRACQTVAAHWRNLQSFALLAISGPGVAQFLAQRKRPRLLRYYNRRKAPCATLMATRRGLRRMATLRLGARRTPHGQKARWNLSLAACHVGGK